MKRTQLPKPHILQDVEIGSLVQRADDMAWGICMDKQMFYALEHRIAQNGENVLFADFGAAFDLWIESSSLARLDYPWSMGQTTSGALAIFDVSGKAKQSIVLTVSDAVLNVFELDTCKLAKRTSDDGSALCYTKWGIDLNCFDRQDEVESIYSFQCSAV